MKALLTPTFLLLLTSASFAQTVVGTDTISSKAVTPWMASSGVYAGSYHFGFSECESNVELKVKNGVVTATKEYTDMSGEGKNFKMHNVTKKFTHVRIVGNKFYSDQATGEFVVAKDGKNKAHGLKVYKS